MTTFKVVMERRGHVMNVRVSLITSISPEIRYARHFSMKLMDW